MRSSRRRMRPWRSTYSAYMTPVTVNCCAYPECLLDQGRDLKKDRLYHGLHPYLHDALSFAMAELPEREQACPTFDTLYTLTKKLEAGQPAHMCQYAPSSDVYRENTGTTLCRQEEWQPWRRKEWHQPTLSRGRTPSQR